jgi:hypothetical protein
MVEAQGDAATEAERDAVAALEEEARGAAARQAVLEGEGPGRWRIVEAGR